ncbi:MAG: rhodanese-like domain-containing protein [Balneolaceae bacterium]|nr:rhodanese-like domain-containing protein [Balneolaceae bacterium]
MNTILIVVGVVIAFLIINFLRNTVFNSVMNPGEVKEKIKNESGVIIDVRMPEEYKQGHLKDADYNLNIMSSTFEQDIEKLDKDKSYYLYCQSGSRSGRAAKVMKKHGFENAYNIGGLQQLVENGFKKTVQ